MNTKTRIGVIVGIIVLLAIIFSLGKKSGPSIPIVSSDQPAAASTNNLLTYSTSTKGFSIKYPADFSIDESYLYTTGFGKTISGVKFTIPAKLSAGTNLGSDTYVSVEQIKKSGATPTCIALDFLSLAKGTVILPVTDGGITYSVASSTGAGAGNRYEETVYAIPGTNPCIAVRYFVHYGVYENYPKDTTKEFDKQAVLTQFDAMRKSLQINTAVVPVTTTKVVGAGERCGGNRSTAPVCVTGFTCTPVSGSHLPFGDVGGTCVKN